MRTRSVRPFLFGHAEHGQRVPATRLNVYLYRVFELLLWALQSDSCDLYVGTSDRHKADDRVSSVPVRNNYVCEYTYRQICIIIFFFTIVSYNNGHANCYVHYLLCSIIIYAGRSKRY